jgi:hypothetical protein
MFTGCNRCLPEYDQERTSPPLIDHSKEALEAFEEKAAEITRRLRRPQTSRHDAMPDHMHSPPPRNNSWQ